jgi:hypothetical protein
MAETNNTQSFKGGTPIFDRSNENLNAWIADKTNLSFTDWLNEKNAGRTNNVDMNPVNASVANNEFGLLSSNTVPPYQDYENFYKIYGSSALAAPAPEAASAPALASTSLSSGQSDLFPNLKIDSQFSAPALSAPTSVLGMFPEVEAMQRALYQQKQNEAMQDRFAKFAQLSPLQQASVGFQQAGYQLGQGVGGALGGKDPQLQQISMRNAIMRRLDPSDPAQQMKIAQEIAQYDPEFAMSIADNARKSAIQIKQASGAARQGITANVQQAERIATAEGLKGNAFETRVAELLKGTDKLSDKQATGARVAEITRMLSPETGGLLLRPSERAALEAELATYEKSEKEPSVGSDREAIAKDMFFKPFSQLTQEQIKAVNAKKKADDLEAAKATVPSSGIKEYKDIPKLRADIISTVKPFRDTVNAADNALTNITLSMNENNFISFNAARVQLAKALAGGDLSQKEIQASGGDPSILGGVFDLASTAITSTPSIDTQQKIKNTIKAIRKVALQKGRAELEVQRTLAKRSNFTDEDFDLASDIPEFRKKPSLKTTESDDALVNKYLTKKP